MKGLLFENWDVFSADAIKNEITNCLSRLEPRIVVSKVDVRDDADGDLNSLAVSIDYTIIGEQITQTIDFLLEKA